MSSARRTVIFALAAWLLLAAVASGTASGTNRQQEKPTFLGLSLTEALQRLQARGVPVFFSSGVVGDSMRIEAEPRGASPREILDEILRPHGLRAEEVLAGRLVVVAAPTARSAPARPTVQDRPAAVEREPLPVVTEEIFVTSDRSGQEGWIGALSLDPAEAGEQPHLGDDPFRAVGLLPGASTSEASSRLQVRGGRDDEVLIVLDGLELLAPYHLQEYDSALSIVAPTSLDRIELSTGGYPAEYGDRMSGVLDMTTLTPPRSRRFGLGLSTLYGDASASGALSGDRGRWYLGGRGGTYHLALEVNGREASPRYGDTFGKLELALRPDQTLQVNALFAEDELGVAASEPGGERYRSYWGNRYLWLTHGAVLSPDLFVETIASVGRIDRARSGSAANGEALFDLRDQRLLDLGGLKHVWRLQPGERRSFEGGVELRRLHSTFDYRSDHDLADPLAALRSQPPEGSTALQRRLDYDQAGAFVSSRLRPAEALTAELGARFDRNGFTDESHVSPRLNLAWKPWKDNVFRLAWGWYYQSQRPNELQVEDGETGLARAERAEHRILGFEHRRGSGATFRLEAYQRRLSRPRARFENLFDPVTLFPELSGARVRIAPDGGLAQGIDLLVRGADRGPLSWWLAYSYSSAEDRLGGHRVPRGIDQPHAFRADLSYRARRDWIFNAAWLYHTGWPTTEVTARVVPAADGSPRIEPVLGPLHGERLPAYHRLDLRVSRTWKLPLGELATSLDLQNLYDRENVRGFDNFAFGIGEDGDPHVHSEAVSWGELLPSLSLRWQF